MQEAQKNKKVDQDIIDNTKEATEAGQDYQDNTYQHGSSEVIPRSGNDRPLPAYSALSIHPSNMHTSTILPKGQQFFNQSYIAKSI